MFVKSNLLLALDTLTTLLPASNLEESFHPELNTHSSSRLGLKYGYLLVIDNKLKLWIDEYFDAIRETGGGMTTKITFVKTQL
ncbi:MAG: hypothetical protein EA343_10205 [Nodularia sp. (in: Bacteria)]|nr:MAG: hypothetical protein EA343_10205 [Nodularia sp. (in: cyanobacteria)]